MNHLLHEQMAADDAIEQARINADQNWMVWALQSVYMIALHEPEFTTDDVWDRLAFRWPESRTHENRAMGAIMRQARAKQWARPSNRYEPTRRKNNHGRPIRVWVSDIHGIDF